VGEVETDRPVTSGERVGQTLLYVFFGALVLLGGWLLGTLYVTSRAHPMAAFGAVGWWLGLLAALPVLVCLFVARPVRTLHRRAWAANAAIGFFGFLRGWSLAWSVLVAVAVVALLVIPRSRYVWA
jgi:hypothetical protein